MEWTRSQRKREQVERLLWKRKHLLDRMFVATPEEVVRMEQVNNRMYDLTQKMYARTEAVYRKMATATYDPEFDDDVKIEGSLRFSPNEHSSVLPMANDDYYGSDFYEIFCVIDWLYTCEHLKLEEVELCWCLRSRYFLKLEDPLEYNLIMEVSGNVSAPSADLIEAIGYASLNLLFKKPKFRRALIEYRKSGLYAGDPKKSCVEKELYYISVRKHNMQKAIQKKK